MSQTESETTSVSLAVENVGGISGTEVTLSGGVTVLTGRNATNRTSLLRAIMAALGSDDVALKGDASEGAVELTMGDTTYTRTLQRRSGTVVFDGEPYLEDSEIADLFAFLLESNDARRAVERGDDLSEVFMRPVDTDEIESEIADLRVERQDLQAELEELESLAERLPELEEQRRDLESQIEEKRRELEETREELEELEADRDQITELDERFDELRKARNRLERTRDEIEDEERVIEALREDRADLEASLDGLAESDAEAAAELEVEIGQLRDRTDDLESTVSQLQSAIQFNENMLNDTRPELLEPLMDRDADSDEGSPTDRLVAEYESMVCWTCGSEVDRAAIEQTIDLLRDACGEKLDERNALREEIDELQAEKRHLERTAEERDRLNRELDEVASKLESRTERLDELRETAESLELTVEDLEAAVDDFQNGGEDERTALHREATELEVELNRLEDDLADLEAEIDSIEERLGRRGELESRLESVNDEIEERRSRIERIRAEVVEQFNDHMETLLDRLQFENLERIWIERVDASDGEETFDLHVVRTNESGSVYEDTIDHLSESEREVVGVVFALSGYLVHEVYERVPFMLLDSLEALDAGRIATLVDYLAEQADNLVVALLPEDAAAVDEDYRRLTEI